MERDYYSLNMQKLLYVVKDLHNIGYESLRIIPGISPSGLYWRCHFITNSETSYKKVVASNWFQDIVDVNGRIDISIETLTIMFMRDHSDFLKECATRNNEYIIWYNNMLNELAADELPYAYNDYFQATTFWKTTKDNKIITLPSEIAYLENL
jgi:hypothetical protein